MLCLEIIHMTLHAGEFLAQPILTHRIHLERGFGTAGYNNPHTSIGLCLSGEAAYALGNTPIYGRIKAGDLYYVAPENQQYFWSPENQTDWEVIYCLFTATPELSELWAYEPVDPREPGFSLITSLSPNAQRKMIRCFLQMLAFARSKLSTRERFQYNGLEELLLWLQLDQAPEQRALDPRVKQALEIIRTQLTEPISVDELARMCKTSRSRLAAVFTEQMGVSPMHYWERCRTEHAMELLKISNLNIDQVANELGYSSASHFSRRFKQYVGESPGRYRASSRDEASHNDAGN